ncbi:tyrosine-type recombinase/integrase [Candidatus Woesearchaeota archaeon]|nr:tyrosine-type recombinase/integrase [Candidatus Woesearchaeota archaeon]
MLYNITEAMKKEMLRRKFSKRTIEAYLFSINKFFKRNSKDPRKISKKDVQEYLGDLAQEDKSGSTLNIHLSAIKFFMEEVLRKNIHLDIRYSRRPKSIPTFLTKDETKELFNVIENKKHKLMVELMYSAGMRVSELLHLRVKDFEIAMDYGWIRKGKGNKDRVFIIADNLKQEIEGYIRENNLLSDDLLFSRNNFFPLHTRTVQEIVKKAAKRAKIRKNVHPHTLRHSFAKHLIDDGWTVTDVQKLLGHNSIQTTMIYTHSADPRILNIRSPFDNL